MTRTLTDRFSDPDELIDALCRQKIILGDREAATALSEAGHVVAFVGGEELMRQGDADDSCFFLLAGRVDLNVNGKTLPYGRAADDAVGEFTAINTGMRRTATVTACEPVAALKCTAADLKAAGAKARHLWRLLAIELTKKVEQRNQLIPSTNERPRIFMIAAEARKEVAEALRLALMRDFDVDLWSDEDLVPPGGYELETLHAMARNADFGIVLAHRDDLASPNGRLSEEEWGTIRFELGYLMAELSRHRTLVMIPDDEGGAAPSLFKGLQPMTYRLPPSGVPLDVALEDAVDAVRKLVAERKVRSRLASAG